MAVRTADLGGTDIADGEIDYAADFNDTLGAVTIHRKQFSDATERSTTSTTYVDSGTSFSLSIPINSLILGMYLTLELRDDSATQAGSMGLQVSGTNFGTKYLTARLMETDNTQTYITADFTTTESQLFSCGAPSVGYAPFAISAFLPIKVLDSTMTFKPRIKLGGGTGTTYIKNVTLDIIYVERFKED